MLQIEHRHDTRPEDRETFRSRLVRLRGWLADAFVNVHLDTADWAMLQELDATDAHELHVSEKLVGATCPECGQYFRRGKSNAAAHHLAAHDAGDPPRGLFQFRPPAAFFTFAGGAGALAISLVSAGL